MVAVAFREIEETLRRKLVERYGTSGSNPRTLAKVFQHFDSDGSGEVSVTEFGQVLARFGVGGLSDDELSATYAHYDIDGNGHLDYAEFVAALFQPPQTVSSSKSNRSRPPTPAMSADSQGVPLNVWKAATGTVPPEPGQHLNVVGKHRSRIRLAIVVKVFEDQHPIAEAEFKSLTPFGVGKIFGDP